MNERIKEIADKAGLYIAYDNREVTDKELEFFAELIVRECAEVGSKFSQAHPEDIRYQIKRHFGVEE